MKRLTETTKWRDPWFRRLPEESKWLWLWLCDNCDQAGVIDLDLEVASFDIGKPIKEQHVAALGERVKPLHNHKLWIVAFIPFQYGKLSPACAPHRAVLSALQHHGISPDTFAIQNQSDNGSQKGSSNGQESKRVLEGFQKGSGTPKDKTRQDPVSVPEGVKGEPQGDPNLVPLPIRVLPKPNPPPSSMEVQATEAAFEKFYKSYPHQVHREDALHAFIEVGGQNMLSTLLMAIENQKEGVNWRRGIGIPNPANWLRDRRWTDKPRKLNPGMI